MKCLLLVLISLLSYASPSFAMLDDELTRTTDYQKQLLVKDPKDFRSQGNLYKGLSQISGADYFKQIMIHPYNRTQFNSNPFSAALTKVRIPKSLKNVLEHHFADHEVVCSFNVQCLPPNDSIKIGNMVYSPHDPFALKPHYFVHAGAPTYYEGKNYVTQLEWTVVPGVEGRIEPASGDLKIHSDWISTHHSGKPDGKMGVSADVMHLKGIEIEPAHEGGLFHLRKNQDLYSLVAYTDEQGRKIAVVTYHWLLSNRDIPHPSQTEIGYFHEILENAGTFRALIHGLEAEKSESFKNILEELKRYVEFSLKEEPLQAPQQPIVEKPVPQKQNAPIQEPQQPIVEKLIPQKQVLPSPSQKLSLQKQTTPVKTNAKAASARTNFKSTLIKKVATTPAPSVVQKPVAQSKASTPIAKASPVKTNAKVAPVRKVATAQARKANATPVPSVVQKPVAKTPAPTVKVTPLKTNTKTTPKAIVPVKKVLTPAAKKATVIVKKILASKVGTRKAPVHTHRANTKISPKETLVHKRTTKTAPAQKAASKKASAHKVEFRKTPVRKASPVRTKAIRAKAKR